MKVKCLLGLTILSMVLTVFSGFSVHAQSTQNPDDNSPTMVVDAINGRILAEEEADQLVEVGDLTKLLTLYLIFQAVEAETISMETIVPISDRAFTVSQDYDINNVPLRQDADYTVEELTEAVLINSANGAAIALAELVGGDEATFVQMMAGQLEAWQIEEYELANATGLPVSYMEDLDTESQKMIDSNTEASSEETNSDELEASQSSGPSQKADETSSGDNQGGVDETDNALITGYQPVDTNNRLTSEGIATIAYHLINDFPHVLKLSQQKTAVFSPDTDDAFDMTNANGMLNEDVYKHSPVDGLMVDDSQEENWNIVATTERNDFRVIAVVLDESEEDDLYQKAGQLFDQAYSAYTMEAVAKKGDPLRHIGRIEVVDGMQTVAPLVYAEDFYVFVPVIDTAPQLSYQFVPNYEYFTIYDQLMAPVSKGTQVGIMEVTANVPADSQVEVKNLDSAQGNRAKVVVSEDIETAPWYVNAWRSTVNAFSNTWESTRTFFTNLFN